MTSDVSWWKPQKLLLLKVKPKVIKPIDCLVADENCYLASFNSRWSVDECFKRGPTWTLIGLEQRAAMSRWPKLPSGLPYGKEHCGMR